jgi:hypothetical protein
MMQSIKRGEDGMNDSARCRELIEACAQGYRSRVHGLFEDMILERAHQLVEAKRREIAKSILQDRVGEVSPDDILPGIDNVTLGQAFEADRWLEEPDPENPDGADPGSKDGEHRTSEL